MDTTIISFEKFEKALMEKILEKDTSINRILREQYKAAKIESRDFTGVGFFTHFRVPETAPRITEPVKYDYGDVACIINDIDLFGFILFIEDGVMKCLEGYTMHDFWPEEITSYTLYHYYVNDKYQCIRED